MELKKYKLGDVATIIVGYPFESERFNTKGKGILLVRGMNVSERYLRFGEEARWWDEITDKLLPYYLQENDVLIGMDGSKVGKNFAIVKKGDLPLLLVQRVACIRAKSGFDQHFIWQYVSSPRFIEYVNTIKTGSSIPHISSSQIANFPIFAPSFEIQTRIGSLLSNLDRKIALNRAINRNLEALAKQLYDYWFVQFDFPDEKGRPYKSSGGKMVWNEVLKREVPEGWEVVSLSQYLDTYVDKVLTKSVNLNDKYAPIEVIPRRKMSFCECAPIENAISGLCRFQRKQILLSNRRVYFHKVCISAFCGLTRDTVIILNPSSENILGYAYQLVNDDMFIEYATRHSYGSEQPVLSWESVKSYKVLKPSNGLDEKYSRNSDSIIENILRNEMEIGVLTKQRDELLPLLMNGQVEIKQLNSDL